jgi:hypothetical protein
MTVVIVGARRAWRDCNHDARCFVHVSTTTTSFCVLVPVVDDIDVSHFVCFPNPHILLDLCRFVFQKT